MVLTSDYQPIAAASQSPRVFPSSGFQIIDPSDKVEGQKLPFYERDEDGKYWTLKGHVNTMKYNQEHVVYRHLVFVITPLGMSLRTLQEMQSKRVFQKLLVTSSLDQVLVGLDCLHGAKVVHTDLHSDNLLVAITDDSILIKVEEGEILEPAARKQDDDRFIYVPRYMLGGTGALIVCGLPRND
ncbi:hypothetical protein MYCTH_2128605 [Thermothelomyces thermophilus ATCC 42464]|uniref:Protein kinase domain-containing protein n=1 Tax=Thermothelomyces thermophilus (strain ATCC 42464 / BCRC 31852 / DSM 1799) TaxID=573729 RepID=G2QIL2_THET4|nr:uncharacterized protein MYCTH_2128605 [Thermothelomyces thermophilus ATCC 42464]AEO59543.1 hypothetical protein MYCTH_2128605 [Thermothelomyces thermophilus ATCC 42464]